MPKISDLVVCAIGFYGGQLAHRAITARRNRRNRTENETISRIHAYTA